jgi:hypothetical protein
MLAFYYVCYASQNSKWRSLTVEHDEVGNQTINNYSKRNTGSPVYGNARQTGDYELALILRHYYLDQLQN